MAFWRKHFIDKTTETGTDEDVQQKKASWSRGRLNDIISVELGFNDKKVVLSGFLGEYWQSDDYEVRNGQPPIRVLRRLQYRLGSLDNGFICKTHSKETFITIYDILDLPLNGKVFSEDSVGKWFTVEISDKIIWYISNEKI